MDCWAARRRGPGMFSAAVTAADNAQAREAMRAMKSVSVSLARLRIPTYVLHGSSDQLVLPSASEPLTQLPNITRRVWDGLRHECFNEPEQHDVIGEVIAWLDAQLSG